MKKSAALFLALLLAAPSYAGKPKISFFTELPSPEFVRLFSDSLLIVQLKEMNAELRIGLLDLTPERANTVSRLNAAGIAVTAWLLLPEDEGYWFNARNGEKANARYDDFKKWSSDYGLQWQGIGIDLEIDMNDAKLGLDHPWKLAWKAYRRLFDRKTIPEAKATYQQLISSMKNDGYRVESYVISFILEERKAGTESLQRLSGIADIETEREIQMLYTSAMKNSAIIPLYHIEGMPIALGSTGGGVKIGNFELAALDWEQLERDLLVASSLTDEIHIFCLESSVEKGFLKKIADLDFDRMPPDISSGSEGAVKLRKYTNIIIRILDHPYLFTLALVIIPVVIVAGIYIIAAWLIRKVRSLRKK